MMGELVRALKLQPTIYDGLECDAQSAYSFILGDLNYRIDDTFEHLSANIQDALDKPDKEQLYAQMKNGFYCNYKEHTKNWLPTYKLEKKKAHVYHNKKEQSPSYCDRILYKVNTADTVDIREYEAYHDVFGSDHRPVTLSMDIGLVPYTYSDLTSDKIGVVKVEKLTIECDLR